MPANASLTKYSAEVLPLQGEEEASALRALAVLTDLHRRNVWRDARTVNVIGEYALLLACMVCCMLGEPDEAHVST